MTRRIRGILAGLVVSTASIALPAQAAQPFMPNGGKTTQPIGHYEFCSAYPAECGPNGGQGAPVHLSRKLWSRIVDINNAVNAMIAPRTDMEMWGREEVWSYPGREGDCEDYALEKRRLLVSAGVPASALLITVVRQRNGDGHAVLAVRTDMGDYVLDNMEGRVLAWNETDYRFLKRQSEKNSGQWVAIGGGKPVPVGSIGQ